MSLTHCLSRRSVLGTASKTGVALLCLAIPARGWAMARFPVSMTDAQWRKKLGPARYYVLRQEGTERAFTSSLLKNDRKGVYTCAGCGQALFSSKTKFDSGTGWPSFWAAMPGSVGHTPVSGHGGSYLEEHCNRCGGHLGHVFDDGPKPTGKRHCINGLALQFRPV